jgi:hypothetical protein
MERRIQKDVIDPKKQSEKTVADISEKGLSADLKANYLSSVEAGFRPTTFLGILAGKGGLETARHYLNRGADGSGLAELYALGRVELSIEALVVRKYYPLFLETEAEMCGERLKQYGYNPKIIAEKAVVKNRIKTNEASADEEVGQVRLKSLKYILVTTTQNSSPTADAESVSKALVNAGPLTKNLSFHYIVDEKNSLQCFDDFTLCRPTGIPEADSEILSVALCVNKKFAFKKVSEAAAELVSLLLEKHSLKIDSVVFASKWLVGNRDSQILSGEWGIDGKEFLVQVTKALKLRNLKGKT